MSIKHKIKEAYKQWERNSKKYANNIAATSSNYIAISAKIKKLTNDLCKFADNFDKKFVVLDNKPLNRKIIGDIYNDICNDLVQRIAKGGDYFIYGIDKGLDTDNKNEQKLPDVIKKAKAEYPDSIKTFNLKFKNLESNFEKAENLVKFFE